MFFFASNVASEIRLVLGTSQTWHTILKYEKLQMILALESRSVCCSFVEKIMLNFAFSLYLLKLLNVVLRDIFQICFASKGLGSRMRTKMVLRLIFCRRCKFSCFEQVRALREHLLTPIGFVESRSIRRTTHILASKIFICG